MGTWADMIRGDLRELGKSEEDYPLGAVFSESDALALINLRFAEIVTEDGAHLGWRYFPPSAPSGFKTTLESMYLALAPMKVRANGRVRKALPWWLKSDQRRRWIAHVAIH